MCRFRTLISSELCSPALRLSPVSRGLSSWPGYVSLVGDEAGEAEEVSYADKA
jgi:hypothetical protein